MTDFILQNVTGIPWSSLTNAASNLTLSNAGFTTTFNQTSAVSWIWANTTAATSGTAQSSPILKLSGQYWTGALSAAETFTIQDVIGNGTSGTSTLTIGHSGTPGAAAVDIHVFGNGATAPMLTFGNIGTNWGLYQTSGTRLGIAANGVGVCAFRQNNFLLSSATILNWTSTADPDGTLDTGITRIAAGVIGIGTGGATSTAGNLQLNQIMKYNGESTIPPGIPYTRGVTPQRSETGADSALVITVPPAATGIYRISIVLSVSAANTATLGWTATWTDSNGHAQAPTNLPIFTSGVATPTLTVTAAVNGTYYGDTVIDVNNSGTNIVVKTTFSGTSIAYIASAIVERLA